jgi:hypothetical protein
MPLFRAFPALPRGLGAGWIDFSERYLPRSTARLERALFPTEFRPWSPAAAPRQGLEGFDPGYLQLQKFTRLIGYFQSPLYLKGHEDAVRGWYRMSSDESADTRRRWAQIGIDPAEAVAVHVRLGDYREQPSIGASEEGGWILPRRADYVARTGNSRVDFCMMSSCARMIIGNSTFSWWAAWLNPSTSSQRRPVRR